MAGKEIINANGLTARDYAILNVYWGNVSNERTGVPYDKLKLELEKTTEEWIKRRDWAPIDKKKSNAAQMKALLPLLHRKLPSVVPLADALKKLDRMSIANDLIETDYMKMPCASPIASQQQANCPFKKPKKNDYWLCMTATKEQLLKNRAKADEEAASSEEEKSFVNRGVPGLKQIFGFCEDDGKRKHRKIVLEGAPATGKTAYLHKLVLQWSQDKPELEEWSQEHKWLNQQFPLLLLVRLGDVGPEDTLFDLLLPQVGAQHLPAMRDHIMNEKNHSGILLVLDAYDEMPRNAYFNELIENHMLGNQSAKDITMIISTRISHTETKELENNRDLLLRSAGFTEDTLRAMGFIEKE